MYLVHYCLDDKFKSFDTLEEAYVHMLQWVQSNCTSEIIVAALYSLDISESYKRYKKDGEHDWFGEGNIITCRKIEHLPDGFFDAPTQVISKDMFIKWVKEIKKIKDNYEMFLDQVYGIFGSSAQDAICNAMNEGYMIKMLEDFVGDNKQTLSYYFYELDCDFSEFDNNVELEGAPSVKDYGDLYDFIMYENGVANVSDDDDDNSDWEDYDDSGWEDYD